MSLRPLAIHLLHCSVEAPKMTGPALFSPEAWPACGQHTDQGYLAHYRQQHGAWEGLEKTYRDGYWS
jgi:hypothetical protein